MGHQLIWLERLTGSQKVAGSSPVCSTKTYFSITQSSKNQLFRGFLFYYSPYLLYSINSPKLSKVNYPFYPPLSNPPKTLHTINKKITTEKSKKKMYPSSSMFQRMVQIELEGQTAKANITVSVFILKLDMIIEELNPSEEFMVTSSF